MKNFKDLLKGAVVPPGTVYYFPDDALQSNDSHYFIVLNHDPTTDDVLFLLCSSSQVEKLVWRCHRRGQPSDTVVLIGEGDYEDFTCDSAVDCNQVFTKTKGQINEKIDSDSLEVKAPVSPEILALLRAGVIKSPTVDNEVKIALQEQE